jgi:hypothetical protein
MIEVSPRGVTLGAEQSMIGPSRVTTCLSRVTYGRRRADDGPAKHEWPATEATLGVIRCLP